MKCLTRDAITVIAMIKAIKLLKYKVDPVINNTKATNGRNKVFALQSSPKNTFGLFNLKTILQMY